MNFAFILLFWLLSLIIWLKIRSYRGYFTIIFKQFATKKAKSPIWQIISKINFLAKPGFIVKKLVTPEKYNLKIQATGKIISFNEFRAIKQIIVSCSGLYFWLFILFGNWQNTTDFILLILAFIFAYFIPDLWLQIKKEKRQQLLQDEVPYFIDILAISLDTGMNIERALRFVADNMNGHLAKEIKTKLTGLEYGLNLESILDNLADYIPVDEFKRFINSIKQAKQLGVSLSKTLEIQSQLIQSYKFKKAEELSRTASVKISIPLVLFIFPALLIIYIGPALVQFLQ